MVTNHYNFSYLLAFKASQCFALSHWAESSLTESTLAQRHLANHSTAVKLEFCIIDQLVSYLLNE